MNRPTTLHRDLTLIFAGTLAAAALVGASIGALGDWIVHRHKDRRCGR